MKITEFTSITENYLKVVGITRGKSAKNNDRPYVQISVVKPSEFGDCEGYQVDTLFFWTDKSDIVRDYAIDVNDEICPLYVGSGDFKRLLEVKVLKGSTPFDKAKK